MNLIDVIQRACADCGLDQNDAKIIISSAGFEVQVNLGVCTPVESAARMVQLSADIEHLAKGRYSNDTPPMIEADGGETIFKVSYYNDPKI